MEYNKKASSYTLDVGLTSAILEGLEALILMVPVGVKKHHTINIEGRPRKNCC
jgi:hypothetical protein